MADNETDLPGAGVSVPAATPAQPRIVCLCGSTRFIDQFATASWELERQGFIVLGCTLLPMWFCGVASHFGEKAGTKEQCDEHHKRKIDLADDVLVLDIDGYIGESTKSEIAYAHAHGKPIHYVREDPDLLRKILPAGAVHAPAEPRPPQDYSERVKLLRDAVYIGSGVQLSERVLAVILAYHDQLPVHAQPCEICEHVEGVKGSKATICGEHYRSVVQGMEDALAAPAETRPEVCPHCELPPALPEVCTPELHEVIERNIARDWNLFNDGFAMGQKSAETPPRPDRLDVEAIRQRWGYEYGDLSKVVLSLIAEIERVQRENKTFDVMLPPLHAKIAELKAELERLRAVGPRHDCKDCRIMIIECDTHRREHSE